MLRFFRRRRPTPEPETFTTVTPVGLVEVVAGPSPSRRETAWRDDEVEFLHERASGLVAAAWDGFARHGAGAVVLWKDDEADGDTPLRPSRLAYTTSILSIPGAGEREFDGWAASLVESYEPKREAVVVFTDPSGLRGYRLRAPMPPPQASQAMRIALN